MTSTTTRLTDMDYDEVSLVALAANQEADVVLFKSGKRQVRGDGGDTCSCDAPTGTENGGKCESCGKPMSAKTVRKSNAGLIAKANALVAISKMNPNHSRTNGQFTT